MYIFLFSISIQFRHLYGNKIQRIPFGMFDNMDSLKTLRLDSNLLECDCSVMWLVKQLHTMKDNLTASVNCKSPEVMDGRNLVDLTDEDFHCSKYFIPKVHFKTSELQYSVINSRKA